MPLKSYSSLYESKITPEKATATIVRNLLIKELPRVVSGVKFFPVKNLSGSNPYMPIQKLRLVGQGNKHREEALVRIGNYLKTLGFIGESKPEREDERGYPNETKYSIEFKLDTDKLFRDFHFPDQTKIIPISIYAYVNPDSQTNRPDNIWMSISGPKAAKRVPGSRYD